MEQRIERVDNIPLIVHWLKKMKIHEIIDSVFIPHGNWKGLSYGKSAVVFLTYILHSLCHRQSGVEPWVQVSRYRGSPAQWPVKSSLSHL